MKLVLGKVFERSRKARFPRWQLVDRSDVAVDYRGVDLMQRRKSGSRCAKAASAEHEAQEVALHGAIRPSGSS